MHIILKKHPFMRRVVPLPFPSDPVVTDAAKLGAAIRAARSNAGMTLVDAALALGISKQTLSDLETAKSSVGLGTTLHVAREMGVALFAVPAGEREIVRRAIMQLHTDTPATAAKTGRRKS